MEVDNALTPLQKALKVNLDEKYYGSFSEIGAGQETSRFFFRAGATANGLAKAMSAYSKEFSDAIYGKEEDGRYVTEKRLRKMLHHEVDLLEKRLVNSEHEKKIYFSYANTVSTINYSKTKKGHGWLGIRFNLNKKNEEYNEIILHVRFKQNTAHLQQNTIGKLGVNLIYGALFLSHKPKKLQKTLYDYIDRSDIEIDLINFTGPLFENVDNRIMSLYLVRRRMTDAIIFSPKQKNLMPADLFYKKNIYVLRGSFKPITTLGIEVFEKGLETFIRDQNVDKDNLEILFEITTNNLRSSNKGTVNEQDFLDRVDLIGELGYNVLISNYSEYYKLTNYFSRYTRESIGLTLGFHNLIEVFHEKYYEDLAGGILESFGQLFLRNLKLYVYPYLNLEDGKLYDSESIQVNDNLVDLYKYFKKNNFINDIKGFNKETLTIESINVPGMIQNNQSEWIKYVPPKISDIICEKGLFGFNKKQSENKQ